MNDRLHDELMRNTSALRRLASQTSTRDLLLQVLTRFTLERADVIREKDNLHSPYKQLNFLIGLLLSTPEPAAPVEFTDRHWRDMCSLLVTIFDHYFFMYYPDPREAPPKEREWWDHREVAMKAFLHYFNTGFIAMPEQLRARIEGTLTPFDETLKAELGISATDAIVISDWIFARLQQNLDTIMTLGRAAHSAHAEFAKSAQAGDWDLDRMKAEAQTHPVKEAAEKFFAATDLLGVVSRTDLAGQFGEKRAAVIWDRFVSRRGEAPTITYMTETNPAEARPLIEVEPGVAFSPLSNALRIAIFDHLTDHLLAGTHRDATLKRRDRFLESQGHEAFKSMFAESAQYYRGAYETKNKQYEHDLVIHWKKTLIVVEAKASPPREPFREPEKAYIRIRDDFRGKGGIQYAFDQGDRLRKDWLARRPIVLFDESGTQVVHVAPDELDSVYVVCLTADDFGLLATDLSALLVKEGSDPYPWAVNVYDLETFIGGLKYREWGPDMLLRYLEERSSLHGKTICGDELELAGIFLRDGTLSPLTKAAAHRIVVTPDNSNIFDEIWNESHGAGHVDLSPREGPAIVILDAPGKAARSRMGSSIRARGAKRPRKGKNAPCQCSSGLKYKRCHGKRRRLGA